ncbi:14 kDa proline-rich protein DC2.15, partial [Glycine soja]
VALFLSFNILFFSMISSSSSYKPPPPSPSDIPVYVTPPPPPPPPRCPNLRICPLLSGLTDLEAAVCVCAQIRAELLGIPININLFLDLVLNRCGKRLPANYRCN